jgi:hypothetical protein
MERITTFHRELFGLRQIERKGMDDTVLDDKQYFIVTTKDDKTNRLLSMEKQLQWFRDIGFVEVDCYWKWLELALLIGYKL